jgi:hypothetical protein
MVGELSELIGVSTRSKRLSPEHKNTYTNSAFFLLDVLVVVYFPFHVCMAENGLTEHTPETSRWQIGPVTSLIGDRHARRTKRAILLKWPLR